MEKVNAVEYASNNLCHTCIGYFSDNELDILANTFFGLIKDAVLKTCINCFSSEQPRVSFYSYGFNGRPNIIDLVHISAFITNGKYLSDESYFVTFIDNHFKKCEFLF